MPLELATVVGLYFFLYFSATSRTFLWVAIQLILSCKTKREGESWKWSQMIL